MTSASISDRAAAMAGGELVDAFGRRPRSLRISVIDRCDLRCRYCMPEEKYTWLDAARILSFAEIVQLTEAFTHLGVSRLRLTGGEPLLRAGLEDLVAMLAASSGVRDLALTTNGTRLEELAPRLLTAGLQRITVSLDSLQRARFRQLTRRDVLSQVVGGLEAACALEFQAVKINAVIMRGFNDDELVPMLEFARGLGAEIRFIEYMDVGGATHWSQEQVVARSEMLRRLQAHYGEIRALPKQDTAPADEFVLADGTRFGVIASVTEPFCRHCDRTRITADGRWYTCLYARDGANLRRLLREQGGTAVSDYIRAVWRQRRDRGAEERLDAPRRGVLYQVDELKQDPHREMHTRGG